MKSEINYGNKRETNFSWVLVLLSYRKADYEFRQTWLLISYVEYENLESVSKKYENENFNSQPLNW